MFAVVVEDVTLTNDGYIISPLSVDVSEVIDGSGFHLWLDARAYAKWAKAKGGRAKSLRKAWRSVPNQVPGPLLLYLHKAGDKAVDALGKEASMEDMEIAGQQACVIAWNKLLQRLEDSAEPRPRSQWLGVKRTAAEMADDENPCLVGRCADAQRGLHWTISVDGNAMSAQRLALTLAGEICPIGLVVRHKCGNPPCINPTHLQWGTVQENNRDKFRDGTAQIFGRKLTAAECAAEWAKPPKELTTAQRLGKAKATLKAFSA